MTAHDTDGGKTDNCDDLERVQEIRKATDSGNATATEDTHRTSACLQFYTASTHPSLRLCSYMLQLTEGSNFQNQNNGELSTVQT
jgi:hypothetical protein